MSNYVINVNKKDETMYDITSFFGKIIIEAVSNDPDMASKIAEKLNETYDQGVREGIAEVKEKLNSLLFT